MTTFVRLRVALTDRPGSLAAVAGIIGQHGGNIVSVDVHHSGVVSVIDDLVVDFAGEHDLQALRNDLIASGAATLLSHQAAHAVDPIVSTLTRASRMIGARRADPDEELARSVAELCSSPVVWVSDLDDAARYEAGRFAIERNGAIALRTTELPSDLADRLPGEVWLLAVPDPELMNEGRVVFVARALANEFTGTEIGRIEALMALHDQVERLLAQPER